MELARSAQPPGDRGLCARRSWRSTDGQQVGTFGAIGCFSLQQGKHITTGEGGLVTTDDPALARRMFLFINKAWGYGDPQPDHYFLALNYRMSELQGAVAVAQLKKLEDVVERRRMTAEELTRRAGGTARHRDAARRAGQRAHLLEVLPARRSGK